MMLTLHDTARRSRRPAGTMLARLAALAAAAAVASLGLAMPALAQEEKVLNIYNWSDYIASDTVRNFERETGIKVRYDVYDSNEVLNAKLSAGNTGYDIVVPSLNWASLQLKAGLLRELDKSKLPNLAHVDPQLQAKLARVDPDNRHLVIWLWGYTTIGINVDKVKAALGPLPMPANSWELLFNPRYAARLQSCGISVLDSPSEVLPAAMVYAGKPAFSSVAADYQAAGQLLKNIRPYIALFSASGYINDMANGSICLALGWSGDINIARQRALAAGAGVRIEALPPSRGATIVLDSMAIPADAPHPNNALLWMNYVLRPQVQASLTNKVFYANASLASVKYVDPALAANTSLFLSDDEKQRLIVPEAFTLPIRRLVSRTYTRFKTGF